MKERYVFIGFGELSIDKIYDKTGNLIKEDGGDTIWNIIYNLGLMNEKAYAIGIVGNDNNAEIAINSLKNVNVNTDYIKIENKKTNIIYAMLDTDENGKNNIKFSKKSLIDNKLSYEISQNIPIEIPEEINQKNSIIVLMNFDNQNVKFIDSIKNRKVALDIGHSKMLENLNSDYMIEYLNKVNICQINYKILEVILKKLNIFNEIDLYSILNLDLLIITYAEKGAKFIYNENDEIIQTIKEPSNVIDNPIDTSGAGDAFFSVILKEYNSYLTEGKNIDINFVDSIFDKANKYACEIIQKIGARG